MINNPKFIERVMRMPQDPHLDGVNKIDISNLAQAVEEFYPLAMSGERFSSHAVREILKKYIKD